MNKIERVLMQEKYKYIEVNGWIQTIYHYIIDSKFRTAKRLNQFLNEQLTNPDPTLKTLALSLRKGDVDDTIINILRWVKKNVVYTSDTKQYGKNEYWATAIETITNKKGDCDDMNSLIYLLARLAGIGSSILDCAIGDVVGGGHFWVLYYSTTHNKLVAIDSTYYYNSKQIKIRQPFNLGNKYKKIWYIFNENNVFKPK